MKPRLFAYVVFLVATLLVAPMPAQADELLMTCVQHGVANMTLRFERETGAPREIQIIGTNTNKRWTVIVGDDPIDLDVQTENNPGVIKVRAGDTITWEVGDAGNVVHGIVFPSQNAAEGFFDFDTDAGEELKASNAVDGFKWGTEKFGADTELAVATVTPDPLSMTCTQHGPNKMTLQFVRESGDPRTIEIVGVNSSNVWTVLVDGEDKSPRKQTKENPGVVKVHTGDEITWKVGVAGNLKHGIVFPSEEAAVSFFEFDKDAGEELGVSNAVDGYKWGTGKFEEDTILAEAIVKPYQIRP